MAKLKSKILREDNEFEALPSHILMRALDNFLISTDNLELLESVALLSIGIETYIKSFLHNKDSNLILRLDWNRWRNIESQFISTNTKRQKRDIIKSDLSGRNDLTRTLDYGLALELFPYYASVPKGIIDDLNEFKEYRNGLFHWKAKDETAFDLSKRVMRVFDWLFKFIERNSKWWIGGEFSVIDPDGNKRKKFNQLKKSIRSENKLNVQRRIFRHNYQYTYYFQINARLEGIITIPNTLKIHFECPACHYPEMFLYEGGLEKERRKINRKIYIRCTRCDFACSDKEFDVLKSKELPSLIHIYDKIKRT